MAKMKQWQNLFVVIANVNSILKHVIEIKNRIIRYINVNVKFIVAAKKLIVDILAHVFERIASF